MALFQKDKMKLLSVLAPIHIFKTTVIEETNKEINRLERDVLVRIKQIQLQDKINLYQIRQKKKTQIRTTNYDTNTILNTPAYILQEDNSIVNLIQSTSYVNVDSSESPSDIDHTSNSVEKIDTHRSYEDESPSEVQKEISSVLTKRFQTQHIRNIFTRPKHIIRDFDDNSSDENTSLQVVPTNNNLFNSDQLSIATLDDSVSIYTDDSMNITIDQPDIFREFYWELELNDNEVYDSEYFEFGQSKWRLTLTKYFVNDRERYSLMLSPLQRDIEARVSCVFKLHGLMHPDYFRYCKYNLVYGSTHTQCNGCEDFIGEDIRRYTALNNSITISAIMKSNVNSHGKLIGYDEFKCESHSINNEMAESGH